MTETAISFESLLKVRRGAVDFVDVPEFGFAAVTGSGAPGGSEFTEALQALYSVSYGAHFLLKKQLGQAPRVMPLEALWWVDDLDQQHLVTGLPMARLALNDVRPKEYCGSPVARHAGQPKAGGRFRTWSAKNVSTRRQESAAAVGS